MPEFKPDKTVKAKIISLIILWGKNLSTGQGPGHGQGQLHNPKIRTREIVRMLNALPGPSVTFDTLKQYWENLPAVQNRIADLNKDIVVYRTEAALAPAPAASPEPPPEPPPADTEMPVDQQALQNVEPPGQTTTLAPVDAPPDAFQDRLQGSRSIVSQMANRASARARK